MAPSGWKIPTVPPIPTKKRAEARAPGDTNNFAITRPVVSAIVVFWLGIGKVTLSVARSERGDTEESEPFTGAALLLLDNSK